MKKMFIIAAILSVMVFIFSGCDGGDTGVTTVDPFIGGTDSISVSFSEGYPPSEVYAGSNYPFSLVLRVKNEGEYDILKDDFKLKIEGFRPESFGVTPSFLTSSANFDLQAKSKDAEGVIIDSTEDFIEFANLAYQEDLEVSIPNMPVQVHACYLYGTKAVSQLCIKKDPTKDDENDVCKVNDVKPLYTSSAPVQIQNLKESPRGLGTIAFTFDIVHNGAGSVFSRKSDCSDERSDENKVWVEVDADLAGLTCAGLTGGTSLTTGFVSLGETSKRTISCSLDVSGTSTDFVEQIGINLEYDYQQILSTSMTIKKNVE